MTDFSRLTPQQIAMQSAKEKYQKEKDDIADQQQNLRDRITKQNNYSHRSMHDLLKSDFFPAFGPAFVYYCGEENLCPGDTGFLSYLCSYCG